MFTIVAESPAITMPGTDELAWHRPVAAGGIVFAPQASRSPPSRSFDTNGWVFSCWRASWTEKVASV